MKFKKALQKAEWVERQAAKEARHKAIEDEEAKKIPYEVGLVTYFLLLCLVHFVIGTFMVVDQIRSAILATKS